MQVGVECPHHPCLPTTQAALILPENHHPSPQPPKFLPPAYEVYGKIMFLHPCDNLFTGGGAYITGHMRGESVQGGRCPGGSLFREGGLCQTPLYGNERVVCILLECILVGATLRAHTCFCRLLHHWCPRPGVTGSSCKIQGKCFFKKKY